MSQEIPLTPQAERAPALPIALDQVRRPSYGRYLEDLTPGRTFRHPRGFTIDRGWARSFATAFLDGNPLYFNVEYARACGFDDLLVSPQLVFNLILSMGVQNDSEKVVANLGYYQAKYLRPVYPGDTLRALTQVVERRERGEGKPGIVHIHTLGLNQREEVVMQYERKIMVPPRGDAPATVDAPDAESFPWQADPVLHLPALPGEVPTGLTSPYSYADSFAPGDVIVHANGRTVTDEHMWWSYGVGNTHPLHNDRIYSNARSGAMSGEPIVYGGLVYAWLQGLTSRDLGDNVLWELGFSEGYHTQPTVSGDTLAAISRVLSVEDAPGDLPAAMITFQLIGVKNTSAANALDTYGAELFEKELGKRKQGKEKIAAKVFEVERCALIRKRVG